MAGIAGLSVSDPIVSSQNNPSDRLKTLYPAVNEDETPLPRSWSKNDKYNFIGLSQNDLRVHYKGVGKNHKDAASVRATRPIPASCGIYYFEVKVISKGRDGYMGIGLSTQGVNMNRLPGWDKLSYGYHGDDGHSFCSSGTGQPYGPTFTTADVVGCCVNLIDHTCFYTKNGVKLGTAFKDLPGHLYPTVGLQTPGEVVEANFGLSPFVFDIEDYMREWHVKTQTTIESFPVPNKKGEWQSALHRIVSTYLVHHGYCATAESFARSTGQPFEEELVSIKNRQRIQKLVLAGRMGEAISTTQKLYRGLLERSPNLLFMLKCRQFIEMVNGTDSEVLRGAPVRLPQRSSSSNSPVHVKHKPVYHAGDHTLSSTNSSTNSSTDRSSLEHLNSANLAMNGVCSGDCIETDRAEIEMDTSDNEERVYSNGLASNGVCLNGAATDDTDDDDDDDGNSAEMEIELGRRQLCGGTQSAVERMLSFGRELHQMSEELKQQFGSNPANKKTLMDAFSLLAYQDPWSSPVGYQLDPVQREPVCAALNSAILESHGLPKQPPLELAISHTAESMKLMSKAGIGSCAFANVHHYLH